MKNMKNKFAQTITELRHRKGITQKQAAAELGVSQALLSHYEKGVRECGLDFLLKASEFYEVPCDILLGKNELPEKLPGAGNTAREKGSFQFSRNNIRHYRKFRQRTV